MARPQTALIVDDEAHVRVFLRLLLKELGIETCWEAADGAQALEMVQRHAPELVLLDVNLPVKNGLAVLTDIRRDHPDVPVVMVSAQSTMTTVLEASRLGAISYVLKQSPREDARRTLQEAIDSLADEEE
jgi:two-component system, chemotaxis family, chemotaxis protein CheY